MMDYVEEETECRSQFPVVNGKPAVSAKAAGIADETREYLTVEEAAYEETYRVLKKGGTFCGCFYIQGQCARTDWFIRNLYQPRGFFTPPLETLESLKGRLEKMYEKAEVSAVEGIGCFLCRK